MSTDLAGCCGSEPRFLPRRPATALRVVGPCVEGGHRPYPSGRLVRPASPPVGVPARPTRRHGCAPSPGGKLSPDEDEKETPMTQPFALDLRRRPMVLAGTSLGPESDAVVRAALRLARSGRGRLLLVHALEPPPVPGGPTGFALAAPQLQAAAHAGLREQLARV